MKCKSYLEHQKLYGGVWGGMVDSWWIVGGSCEEKAKTTIIL